MRAVKIDARDWAHVCGARRLGILAALGGVALALSPVAVGQPGSPPAAGSIWTLQGENDSVSTIPGGSDKFYTSGLRLGWTSRPQQVPEEIARLAASFWGEGTTRVAFDITQQIFTPADTEIVHPNTRDRPVAAYLAGTVSVLQDVANTRNVLALSVGVIGPTGLGRQVQNGFHELIGDRINRGWGAQLPNEPALEVLAGRTWRLPVTEFGGIETDVLPSVDLGIGTVRDYAQSGVMFRIGQGLESDFGVARAAPGISGGDAFSERSRLPWYVFAGVDGQVVARDAILDGDIWTRSAHVPRNWLLGEMEAGVAIIWHGTRISYVQTWQTASFKGQRGGLFNFGSLTASIRL